MEGKMKTFIAALTILALFAAAAALVSLSDERLAGQADKSRAIRPASVDDDARLGRLDLGPRPAPELRYSRGSPAVGRP